MRLSLRGESVPFHLFPALPTFFFRKADDMITKRFLGILCILALAGFSTADDNIKNLGYNISHDDVGSELMVQRVKVQTGVDGSATDVSTAAPLPARLEPLSLSDFTSTGTSPIDLTWDPGAEAEIHQVQLTLTGATGTSQSLTLKLNAVDGVLFGTTFLGGTDGDMTGEGSLVYDPPERPIHLTDGSKLDVDWLEDSTTTWALKIKFMLVP